MLQSDPLCNDFHRFVNRVDEVVDEHVLRADGMVAVYERMQKPFDERTPVLRADENNRHLLHLFRLHQRQYLEKFIECAETAREKNVYFRREGEHDLAREKVVELLSVGRP